MSLYIENDSHLTDEELEAFKTHLESCAECAREYEESRFVISLVKRHWTVSEDTLALIEKANQHNKPRMTVEEGWKDLCRRCPDLAESTKKRKSLQFFVRISAVAACLVIGILTWMMFSNALRPHTLLQPSSTKQVASMPKPSVKVELVSGDGKLLIPTSGKFTTTKELKALIIKDKHRMVMNTNTTLTVEPLLEDSRLGCLVKLASGEILAHVEHDGNPFAVSTANGKAVITGTVFNIKATDISTKLVVSEGTVQFKSEHGIVNVAAGQTSEIIGQSAPSIPISCNAAELTAWATGYEPGLALAQAKSDIDSWYLSLSVGEEPIVLEQTDYGCWVEQKRNWFKQQFPWIFQFKDALAKEGIEVDYPELLIETGNVWQFICFDTKPARFSVIDPNSLLKTASNYGFDKQWLLKNVPLAKNVQYKSLLMQNPIGLAAFEKLLKNANRAETESYYLYPAYACKYLAETRSLIWFAVREGQFNLTEEQRTEVLALLQEEVTAAHKCQNDMFYHQNDRKSSCDENKYQGLLNNEIELMSSIYECEKALSKYDIPVPLAHK